MPELIDKGKLLSYLAAIKPDEYVSAFGEAAVQVIGLIEEYVATMPTIEPEVRRGRWIPCSDRLPENDAKCLVCTSDHRVCMARWYGTYDEQGVWYIISDATPKLYRIKNVPHWMPLPEPPKEDENG